jgi:4'-phosphopantetheinyl transferase EntD
VRPQSIVTQRRLRRAIGQGKTAPDGGHRLSQCVRYRWLHRTDVAFPFPLSSEACSRLPPAVRRAAPKRQREFLAGRYCAGEALTALGAGATYVAMAETRAPIWPDQVIGSITHAGDFAAAAVASAADLAGLGIDSELIIDPAAAPEIAAICMVDEAMLFRAAGGRHFCEFLTFVFSAKEAVFKCLFPLTRKFLEFSDVQITSVDWDGGRFTWTTADAQSGSGRLSQIGGLVHTSVELPPGA